MSGFLYNVSYYRKNSNMKQTIRLTENDLKGVIKDVILETAMSITENNLWERIVIWKIGKTILG